MNTLEVTQTNTNTVIFGMFTKTVVCEWYSSGGVNDRWKKISSRYLWASGYRE